MSSFRILSIITLAFIAFAVETDIYIPSFPEMLDVFHVTDTQIQLMVSLNFLGLCLSCLFSGPLSDYMGRRPVLFAGTGLFALASLLCFITPSFVLLVLGRFMQGIGAGTILSVGCSCVFDRYDPIHAGRLVAMLNAFVTIAMSGAPLMGVWLNLQFGWRASFLFILLLSSLSWIFIALFLPETQPVEKKQPFSLKSLAVNYVQLLKNKSFMLHCLTFSGMFSVLIIFTANSSLLFIEHLHVSKATFGIYQSISIGTFAIASLLCSYLIGRFGDTTVKKWGSILFFTGILSLIGIQLLNPTYPLLISGAMAIVSAGTAMAIVIYFTNAIQGISNTGTAVSLAQGTRVFTCYAFTELSRVLFDGTLWSILIVHLLLSAIVLGCMGGIIHLRRREKLRGFEGSTANYPKG